MEFDKNHCFKGTAIIEFGLSGHVCSAIEKLNGTIFLGRKLWVSKQKRSVSGFLRIPQNDSEISLSNFCGLLRKTGLYEWVPHEYY